MYGCCTEEGSTGTPVFGKEHMLQISQGFFLKMTQDAGRDAPGGGMVGPQKLTEPIFILKYHTPPQPGVPSIP